ncbi:helix-turn-helix transcriptional regulator [Pseudomonas sp. KNUC1026]|uniref:helix-turn-helix transcriptional regulator n=1 Tax=Pseudomonas sp. KNUC1026 TaxID=2893890 RepID=UPI001F26AB3D|nr:helix-turn-helix transcriptional regulator [Pseudomonas sp. KNUC1026]UFH50933.1 helix-turn-helix transcriptional regulator [Pseudomonas sp. KNUC1026]
MGRAIPDDNQDAMTVFATLTPKEQQVLGWCCHGKTAADIAMLMHCSVSTVNFHTHNLHRKFGLNSTTYIAVIAASLGLVPIKMPTNLLSVTRSQNYDDPDPAGRRPPRLAGWGLDDPQ